jgi:argininosuccinate lyase
MLAAAGEGYTTATAVADALVRRGVAFRAAHHIVGRLVGEAERGGVGLDALDDATIVAALVAVNDSTALALTGDAELPGQLRSAAALDGALAGCDVVGGTAPKRVKTALAAAKSRLGL